MNELEFLTTIYKKTFYANIQKKISIKKIREKLPKIKNNKLIDRVFLYTLCGRFSHYLNSDNEEAILLKKDLDKYIEELVEFDYKLFKNFINNVKVESFLNQDEVYKILGSKNLIYYYTNNFIPQNVKKEIKKSIVGNPEDDYPMAREMKRHFVLHIGPTNSGKTYQSLERLKECKKGIYLGPLRLLALEIYDKFNRSNVPCNMITGEEELLVPGALCQSSTIEMLNINDFYDIAVVDEVQMISDIHRGYNWTKAILGLAANEIHLCMSENAKNIVIKLIEKCNDTYEIHYHKRNTELIFDNKDIDINNLKNIVEPGDALIVFSKKSVLAYAAELENKGIKASVIYGNLPPDTRKHQVELFTTGETQVVVSTDAIGMGLNLPIKRIIFLETSKFDGTTRRMLNSQEIKQIAGRAGRMGIYEKGYVLSISDKDYIKESLTKKDITVDYAPLGFPEELLKIPYGLNYLMQTWSEMNVEYPYVKMDVSELLELYDLYEKTMKKTSVGHTKEQIYDFITCPLDIRDIAVTNDWLKYCLNYNTTDRYDLPVFIDDKNNLNDLESYYKRLDLYYQFSRKTNKIINHEELKKYKSETVNRINKIFLSQLSELRRKCNICGKPLEASYQYGMCKKCFKRKRYY